MTIDILHGEALEEGVIGIYHYGSADAYMHCIVTTTEAVVLYHYAVT